MTTINDIADLVRILRTDPDWAEAVRSILLSQELKRLPEEVAALTKAVRENTETVNRRLENLESGQQQLQAGADRTDATLNAVRGDLGNLSGSFYQRDATRFANQLARRRFSLTATNIIHAADQPGHSPFTELLDQAVEDPVLDFTEDDAASLERADTVIAGQDSGGDKVYLVAEISITVYADDVSRAKQSADRLAYATGARTQPLVIGETISAEAQALADARGVAAAQFTRKRTELAQTARPEEPPADEQEEVE